MHNPTSLLENEAHKHLWDFDIQTNHLISTRRSDHIIINKKKTCKIVDYAVPADRKIKLKDSEKKDKCLELARELKKLRNKKMTIILTVIGTLSIITKGLIKGLEGLEIRGRMGTIQTTTLLRSDRMLRRVPEN